MPLEVDARCRIAILTVSTAISGGSLTEYISCRAFTALRDCRVSQPVSQDFTSSPSATDVCSTHLQPNGEPFFSLELPQHYWNADGRFVCDDDSTLAAGLAQLAGCRRAERVRAVSGCGRAAEAADVRQHCIN